MLKKNLRAFTSGVVGSIGLIYFFILPVYFPIRALGAEINAYKSILHDKEQFILFFSQITILIAFMSILLSFCMDYLNKKFFENKEGLIITWYRFIASILSIVFVITSYFVLNPTSTTQLYFWSGIHYLIISFFQLLIRVELSTYKNNPTLSISQANNYFGFSLNLVAVISIFIFSWFYNSSELVVYSQYCMCLEIVFVFYLLLGRGYIKAVTTILSLYGFIKTLSYLMLLICLLIISALLALLVMSIGILAPVITLIAIVFIYQSFKKTIKINDLKLVINISLGYGLILAALTGSVLTYFLQGNEDRIDLFNFAYSSEPLVSLLLGLIMAWILVQNKLEYSRDRLYKHVSLLSYMAPIVFILFGTLWFTNQHILWLLVIMFAIYSFVEYMSMFLLRQVALLSDYDQSQGSRLASFNTIVLNGLCPSLIYISVFSYTRLTTLSLDITLMNTILGLILISLSFNLVFRYGVK